ncbi:hypothetical protein AAHC03_027141 [Spirometra sp. Aus1]
MQFAARRSPSFGSAIVRRGLTPPYEVPEPLPFLKTTTGSIPQLLFPCYFHPHRCRLKDADIVLWLICHAGADDISEAVHLGSYISAMGYLFSIDDHMMVAKNDSHT